MRAIVVVQGAAVAGLVALVLGPIGTRLGWWRFTSGFLLLAIAALLGAAAIGFGVRAGLVVGQWRGLLWPLGLGAVVLLVVVTPLLSGIRSPSIHDISTDLVEPPSFVALLPLRPEGSSPAGYDGPEAAEAQRRAYPDLRALTRHEPVEQAVTRCLEAARALGWTVVAADAGNGRIEATDTTYWFRFTDDIVVRVRPAAGGALIDVRSKSRVGRGDLGANAARIRAFLAVVAR